MSAILLLYFMLLGGSFVCAVHFWAKCRRLEEELKERK